MARDGSGNYTIPEAEFVYEEVIDQDAVNHNFADIAAALTQSIASDGQTAITANLPMSGFRHTGVSNATARTDYAVAGQVLNDSIVWCGTAGGTANAITLSPPIPISAYAAGQRFRALGGAFNTGNVTVAVSGQAAKAVYANGGELPPNTIWTGQPFEIIYDGTRFHLTTLGQGPSETHRNVIINPAFEVAQEATTAIVGAGGERYVVDQWYHVSHASNTSSVSQVAYFTGITSLPHEQFQFLRITSAVHGRMTQPIEDVRTLAGQTVTLTFWARSSANGATVTPRLEQYFGSGGSSTVNTPFAGARTLTTNWERFRQTVTLPAVTSSHTINAGNCLILIFELVGDGMSIDFGYVQLERGPQYTIIHPRTFAEELRLCQRYWQSSYDYGVFPGTVIGAGGIMGTGAGPISLGGGNAFFPVVMRGVPTVTIYSPGSGTAARLYNIDTVADVAAAAHWQTDRGFFVLADAATIVTGQRYSFHYRANARF